MELFLRDVDFFLLDGLPFVIDGDSSLIDGGGVFAATAGACFSLTVSSGWVTVPIRLPVADPVGLLRIASIITDRVDVARVLACAIRKLGLGEVLETGGAIAGKSRLGSAGASNRFVAE